MIILIYICLHLRIVNSLKARIWSVLLTTGSLANGPVPGSSLGIFCLITQSETSISLPHISLKVLTLTVFLQSIQLFVCECVCVSVWEYCVYTHMYICVYMQKCLCLHAQFLYLLLSVFPNRTSTPKKQKLCLLVYCCIPTTHLAHNRSSKNLCWIYEYMNSKCSRNEYQKFLVQKLTWMTYHIEKELLQW